MQDFNHLASPIYQPPPQPSCHSKHRTPNITNPTVHLYDLEQEATGTIPGLPLYIARGYNMAKGLYLIPTEIVEATQEQARYLIETGINTAPAILHEITSSPSLTQAACDQSKDIKQHAKELQITQLEPFIHTHATQELALKTGLQTPYHTPTQAHQTVEASNNKGQFLQFLASQKLNVPQGRKVQNLEQAQFVFTHLLNQKFPAAFVKITRSASGDGTICTHNQAQLTQVLTEPRFAQALSAGEIYIDGLMPYTQSPSVLFKVTNNGYQILGSNYQILAKKSESDLVPTVHKGAKGPISTAHMKLMHPHILATVQFLQNQGYQGQANVEGLLTPSNQYYTIETNARQTGATTPSLESLMIEQKHQRANFWYCNNNLSVKPDTNHTQILDSLQDILYNDTKGWGAIISNFAIISSGKVQLTIHAPNQGMLNELIQETHKRLHQLN